MSSYTRVGEGKDEFGRPWKVFKLGDDGLVIDTRTELVLDGAERDRFAEAVARAVTPGHVPPAAGSDESPVIEGTVTPEDEACPFCRPDENGTPWPCVLGMAHNNQGPDYDPQETVHRDQSGTEWRVARCQDPAAHGMPHCWCAIPGHHKPIERDEETA